MSQKNQAPEGVVKMKDKLQKAAQEKETTILTIGLILAGVALIPAIGPMIQVIGQIIMASAIIGTALAIGAAAGGARSKKIFKRLINLFEGLAPDASKQS